MGIRACRVYESFLLYTIRYAPEKRVLHLFFRKYLTHQNDLGKYLCIHIIIQDLDLNTYDCKRLNKTMEDKSYIVRMHDDINEDSNSFVLFIENSKTPIILTSTRQNGILINYYWNN